MFGVVVTVVPALGCFVLMIFLWVKLQHRKGSAAPFGGGDRRGAGNANGAHGDEDGRPARVDDRERRFCGGWESYVCRNLWMFSDNSHVGDVDTKYDFPAGQEVGLYYDRADPRLCAWIVDKPRYFPFIWAGLCGVMSP